MKKSDWMTVMVLGGLTVLSPLGRAQEKSEAKPAPKGATAVPAGTRLPPELEKLNLTDEQKPKVLAALKEATDKVNAIRGDAGLPVDQRREKFLAIQEGLAKKMKDILTPEQLDKWQKSRDDLRAKSQPAGKRPAAEADSQSKTNSTK